MLKLDWVGHNAAKHACTAWHYSRCVPAGRLNILGVWESERFIGVVIFGRGSNNHIGGPYGLAQTAVCELTRVALREHQTPVSRIVSVALRLLRARCPGLRLVVSYAAGERGHHGGIYQAGGWLYEGPMDSFAIRVKGEDFHARTVSAKYGRADIGWLRANVDPGAESVRGLVRHKYLMPLDSEMREQIAPLALPYPKRAKAGEAECVSPAASS